MVSATTPRQATLYDSDSSPVVEGRSSRALWPVLRRRPPRLASWKRHCGDAWPGSVQNRSRRRDAFEQPVIEDRLCRPPQLSVVILDHLRQSVILEIPRIQSGRAQQPCQSACAVYRLRIRLRGKLSKLITRIWRRRGRRCRQLRRLRSSILREAFIEHVHQCVYLLYCEATILKCCLSEGCFIQDPSKEMSQTSYFRACYPR